MSTERIIKKQALSYLSQDNWATAIGGFFILLLPPILIILFAGVCESISEYFSLGNFETPAIILINILIILLYIFSTPIITGYLRLCYHIAKVQDGSISDVFYYFKKGQYFRALSLNLRIMALMLIYSIGIIAFISIFSSGYYTTGSIVFFYISIIISVIAVISLLFFFTQYTVIPIIFFEDESLSVKEAIRYGKGFMKGKEKDTYTLFLTFFPYFVLCFFVIPWLFVFPYLMVSLMNNGKWIASLHLKSAQDDDVLPRGTNI